MSIAARLARRPLPILLFSLALIPLSLAPSPLAAATSPPAEEKAPVPAVVVTAIEEGLVDKQERFIGTIKAIQSVDIKARVEGFLTKLAFAQGAMVAKDQLLYQIEQAPFQATLDGAKAQLAVAQASQAAAEADLANKQLDLDRQDTLLKKGDTSQANRDKAKAQRDEAQAAVDKGKAQGEDAKASIATAQINLGYTTITSPIAGRIGPTKYTEGNLVNTASGTLATVVQLDPIRAVFSIPSAIFVRIAEVTDGGSIYWVIGGFVRVRQRILEIREEEWDDGTACAALVLDPALVPVEARPMKPFQGWRYLKPEEAPADLAQERPAAEGIEALPPKLRRDLAELCLI